MITAAQIMTAAPYVILAFLGYQVYIADGATLTSHPGVAVTCPTCHPPVHTNML